MLDKSYLDQDHTDLDMIFNNQQDDNGGSINILNWENDFDKRDENLFEENQNQDSIFFNKSEKYNPFIMDNVTNKLTKPNTKTFKIQKPEENDFQQNNEGLIPQMQSSLVKKRGRKTKKISKLTKFSHNKFKEDNIMRKIKTHLFEYIVNRLNLSLSDKRKKFYKIDKSLVENLKRSYNLELMEKTILDIFMNEKISNKYKRTEDKFYNAKLICSILDENREKETINLLNMKIIDIINFIKENQLEEFLSIIENKEKGIDESNSKEYMNLLRQVLIHYKSWFSNKRGRTRIKKDNKEKN